MQEKEIIFGAPGCGKTTYLMNVLEKELQETPPDRIAFVSFTKKGSYEGLMRAMEKFNFTEDAFPYFRTLHSICFKELGTRRYDMLSRKDYKTFSEAMNMNFVGYYTEEFYHNDDRFLYLYFLKLNNYPMYVKVRDATQEDVKTLKHVAMNYNRYKDHFVKLDFTDLLTNIIDKKITLDVDVAIIDEAQDLTTLQWKVCEQLFSKARKVYIAGDDDQAIYEWTGADVHYFLGVEGKRVILDKSWRLRKNLLEFAKKISSRIDERVDKDFHPAAEGGTITWHNSIKGFDFKKDETYYCLARNNYFLKRYTEELRKQVKLFTHKGKHSADQDLVNAINNFKAFREGRLPDKEVFKLKKYLRKDVSAFERLEWYEAFNLKPDEQFYYRQLIKNKVKLEEPQIVVNTIHGVKGGEADNVILLLDVTKVVYKQLYAMSDSELRCLYVACTRAKNNLHIIHAQTKFSYNDLMKELESDYN